MNVFKRAQQVPGLKHFPIQGVNSQGRKYFNQILENHHHHQSVFLA